ncbi:unnamed protein product [Closterium sp. Naga37s-1]|nr:unnamed protein product [Closterium sp. Naga37s-1]CAI5498088.1 unnamed protein product [Closterium sp. Naga37s-1]
MGGSELSLLDGVSHARNAPHDARDAAHDFAGECHESQCLKRGPAGALVAKECTVCLSDFIERDLVRTLPCAHRFHVSCIDHWLADRTTCPVCRVDLSTAASDVTVNDVTTERQMTEAINSGSRSGAVSLSVPCFSVFQCLKVSG